MHRYELLKINLVPRVFSSLFATILRCEKTSGQAGLVRPKNGGGVISVRKITYGRMPGTIRTKAYVRMPPKQIFLL